MRRLKHWQSLFAGYSTATLIGIDDEYTKRPLSKPAAGRIFRAETVSIGFLCLNG